MIDKEKEFIINSDSPQSIRSMEEAGYRELVRCKDCKHRPKEPDLETYKNGFDLEFPDSRCPCECDDGFYSWYPDDNWFCGNGERKG